MKNKTLTLKSYKISENYLGYYNKFNWVDISSITHSYARRGLIIPAMLERLYQECERLTNLCRLENCLIDTIKETMHYKYTNHFLPYGIQLPSTMSGI